MKLLVVVARGLQAGALGCYGNAWIDTPVLDRLAADGLVFDAHFSDRPEPDAARRAWRSGLHDFPDPDAANPAPPGGPDLLAVLRAAGVYTSLVLDDSRATPGEFAQGWDEVRRASAGSGETALEAAVAAAEEALEGLAGREHWLLWVEFATPLPPWEVPEEFQAPYFEEPAEEEEEDEDEEEEDEEEEDEDTGPDEAAAEEEEEEEPLEPLTAPTPSVIDPGDDHLYLRLQSSYAAAVSYLDAGVGQLLESLEGSEAGPATAVLFTSDCGQNLGEHGTVGPVRAWLHGEVVHLPLLLRLPGGEGAGRRVAALTQPVDLAPTLAALFGAGFGPSHGYDLLPLARGRGGPVRAYACAGLRVGDVVEWALRTPEWAYLLPVAPAGEAARPAQLYVKPDDRWEVNNVIQHHLDLAEHLGQVLRGFVAASRGPGPLQPPVLHTEEELQAESAGPGEVG